MAISKYERVGLAIELLKEEQRRGAEHVPRIPQNGYGQIKILFNCGHELHSP